ncbi:MAG: multidrug resistance efflux transporter family protein [Eubacteriales bacterium]|nr:multidrug resistance efflux transporter family protein [Eubacteriales bacterium]
MKIVKNEDQNWKKAFLVGILASMFFAFTFVFNRSMNLGGGYWLWSASLRYLFTLPIMFLLVWKQHGLSAVFSQIKKNMLAWVLWSTVGFGLFYLPLTMASVYGESWFVAASWQLTIVAGIMLTPFFGNKIPVKNLIFSGVILIGIAMLQVSHIETMQTKGLISALCLILIAAFSYPLGNRKMMTLCSENLSTIERVFGMTLCSIPFWLIASVFAYASHGAPSGNQMLQSFIVALFSGVIATLLFFEATNMVRNNPKQLAFIEATQAGEVIFTLIGGILFLKDPFPSLIGFIGILIIVIGMIGNSLVSA